MIVLLIGGLLSLGLTFLLLYLSLVALPYWVRRTMETTSRGRRWLCRLGCHDWECLHMDAMLTPYGECRRCHRKEWY